MGVSRLDLVPATAEMVEAAIAGPEPLGELLGAEVQEGWPAFPQAFPPTLERLRKEPGETDWWMHFFVDREKGLLVGNGGFKGPPDAEGVVEIGYEVAPGLRGRGYGTSAASGMVDRALEEPSVRAVIAHTLAEENASNGVLKKLGFAFDGEVPDPNVGATWRWRLERPTGGG